MYRENLLIKSSVRGTGQAFTTTTSVLMSLSCLAGVGIFCFNLLLPFLLIACILTFQATSLQIFIYALFPWSTLLPFLSYFNFHNLTYLGIDVSKHDMTIPPQAALNDHILSLHNSTHPITKNSS